MATSTRRTMLRAAGMAGAALPFGLVGPRGFATSRLAASLDPIAAPPICHAAAQVPLTVVQGPRKNLRLTWNASAICTVGVPVAQTKGYFEKRNLAVELINFGGSTDQLLEAIATGKADAGVGMALRWLKPLEQGFDVRITTAIHGGCMRLLAIQGKRHHYARGPQGQDHRRQRHGRAGQELLLDPAGEARHRSAERRGVEGLSRRHAVGRAAEGRDPGLHAGRSAGLGDARPRRPDRGRDQPRPANTPIAPAACWASAAA